MNRKSIRLVYPEGRQKAFTLSYDDGCTADRKLVGIFNKNKLKGTFHLNSGGILDPNDTWHINADEVKDLYAGHEVSIHTLTHPYPDRVSKNIQFYEIVEDRRNLEQLCGYAVRGMSYPMGTWNQDSLDILKATDIVYSRTTRATNSFALPENWLLWHPTAHQSHHILDLADRFLAEDRDLSTLYVWGHSFEFDRNPDNELNNWKMMEEFCEKMSGHDNVWYATNIEIYDYITAQSRLYYTMDLSRVTNPSALPVWVKVNGTVVKVPGGATVEL